MKTSAKKDRFVIGETGFGTGLNFLTTWHAWRNAKPNARLTFISAEAFPMTVADLEKSHSAFPELNLLSEQLRAAWPPAVSGFHPRCFDDGNVSLLLMFGEAAEMYKQLNAKIDAWYLDGFAPAKNPGMWTDALFKRIAQLSNSDATIATFTAAGFVRRGLEAQGFDMSKTRGFGQKRERLIGSFLPDRTPLNPKNPIRATWSPIPRSNTNHVVVVGDGIAGSSVAYALASRGLKPLLLAPRTNHTQGHVLPAAILAPQLLLADPLEKAFFYSAFFHAVSHPAYRHAFAIDRGTKYLPTSAQEKQKFKDILAKFNWGPNWLIRDGEGLNLPKGGTVSPVKILNKLTSNITRINREVARLEKCADGWRLVDNTGDAIIDCPTVVLTVGVQTTKILTASNLIGTSTTKNHPSVRPRGGQLECIETSAIGGIGEQTLIYGGYVSAATITKSGSEMRTVGSSYEKLTEVPPLPTEPTDEARQAILAQCRDKTGATFAPDAEIESWTGVRATAPDHMPYAGPIPDWTDLNATCGRLAIDRKLPLTHTPKMETGLYCLTALGSKGFQYGPLLGEYLAAMICGDPSPIPQNLQAKLHPARGFVRDIIRGNVPQNAANP